MSRSDEQIERADKNRARAATAKQLPSLNAGKGGIADWHNADENKVLRLVCLVGMSGGAVRYGYTRDGGAYSIGIYLGDDSKTYYCNEKEGINEKLIELIGWFEK